MAAGGHLILEKTRIAGAVPSAAPDPRQIDRSLLAIGERLRSPSKHLNFLAVDHLDSQTVLSLNSSKTNTPQQVLKARISAYRIEPRSQEDPGIKPLFKTLFKPGHRSIVITQGHIHSGNF